ncbi:hypothetical protein LTR96_000240 [Exophiala xenobiotica]|nr:hypothetical protein LTR96_000240 [Exophiala xenobiotica]KAK5323241.1 hypothetical protein LTR93_005294 [Exophiala xenobiotica]KAK5338142.1 hypothetical protein LTR98_005991 [Exophiala xenobiotica]
MALPKLKAAACHLAPVFLSAKQTTEKTIKFIDFAANKKAKLAVFPESSIPGFPYWSSILAPSQGHDFFKRIAEQSVYVDGEEISAIRRAAHQGRVMVSIGISEKVRYSSATLFNTNLIIGDEGQILVHHRKLMPTFFEKLTWAPGDGYGLRVADTQHGKIGALICGENTNALARYAMMAQGEQVHISTWPAIWPTRLPKKGETGPAVGNYDNVKANTTRAAAHCFEAKCFGIQCAGFLDQANIAGIAAMTEDPEQTMKILSSYPQAATQFLDPDGQVMNNSLLYTLENRQRNVACVRDDEGILIADLDLNKCVEGKQYHDVVGGYQRLDVFSLQINRKRLQPVTFNKVDDSGAPGNSPDIKFPHHPIPVEKQKDLGREGNLQQALKAQESSGSHVLFRPLYQNESLVT